MADTEEYNGDNLIYEAEVSDAGVDAEADGDEMEVWILGLVWVRPEFREFLI